MLTMSEQLDTNLQVFFGPFSMSKSTGSDEFCCALICWVKLFSFFWYQVEEAILFISVPQNSFWVNVFLLFAIATRRMLCCQIKSMIWKDCFWSKMQNWTIKFQIIQPHRKYFIGSILQLLYQPQFNYYASIFYIKMFFFFIKCVCV